MGWVYLCPARWGAARVGGAGGGGGENALGLAMFDVCTKAETSGCARSAGWSSPKALAG